MWWNVYIALRRKFPAESVRERIFKIGSDLTKLLPKVWWLPFLGHSVVANSVHTADATQLDSRVASASAVYIGLYL